MPLYLLRTLERAYCESCRPRRSHPLRRDRPQAAHFSVCCGSRTSRSRCIMNHALFWVTPMDRDTSQELIPFLLVHDEPQGRKPLIQAERRFLKDRASLQRELTALVMAATLPAVVLLGELDVLRSAARAFNAIGQRLATRYSWQFFGSGKYSIACLRVFGSMV